VILAAELLKCADQLVKEKIHPTSIISGYRLASKEAVRYIKVRYCHMLPLPGWQWAMPCPWLHCQTFRMLG
jgi:hypothetical protein